MPNLIQRAQASLVRILQESAGVSVTYTLVSGEQATLTAWVGRTAFSRTASEPGPATIIGERDYLIAVADLVVGGQAVQPAKGHRITETIAGADVTFEVVPPEADEPAWRYSDQTRTVYRLHCKRVT